VAPAVELDPLTLTVALAAVTYRAVLVWVLPVPAERSPCSCRTLAMIGRLSRGWLTVAEHVVPATCAALQASSGNHRSHEGLVFRLGRTIGPDTLVLAVATPPTEHRVDGVFVAEPAVQATTRAARALPPPAAKG
jgi:hypothetical protein